MAGVARLVADLNVKDFCDRLSRIDTKAFCKSWIGINFLAGELLGLKTYFTFYGRLGESDLARVLPDATMRSDFLEGVAKASPEHVSNPFHPGSGYTFCIKVDRNLEPTLGFYFRVAGGEKGIFRLYGRHTYSKEYSYISDLAAKRALADRFSLPFLAECETVELGRGRGHGLASEQQEEKAILIGDFEKIRSRLFDAAERRIIDAVENAYTLQAVCGGIYGNGVKSFYLIGPWDETGNRIRTVEQVVYGRPGRRAGWR